MNELSARANFIVKVGYEEKEPFFVGTFKMDRSATKEAQILLAEETASKEIEEFWLKHMPDGSVRPKVIGVELGSLRFSDDDYEWRKG